MMGAWKSTVGRKLSRETGLWFKDMDREIEREAGLIVTHIFEVMSEQEFRELEQQTLNRLIKKDGQIIATGGGVVLSDANRFILTTEGYTFYLKAQPETLDKRIKNVQKRPVLQRSKNKLETLRQIYNERKMYYETSCHKIIDTDDLSPEDVVEKIVELL
ncbi:MAG: shikimate kinase [Candidatus Marinimicrobia bacterium]|nr:shikimate kinase [Candidatus Neomarinimicrobiota bacterium]